MFKVDTTTRKLLPLEETTLAEQGLKERGDLETILVNSFDEFVQRIGIKAMLIGRQVYVADEVLDHLDLLAVEASGKVVVVELKRSYDDNQLYQALGYAAMLADWTFEDFVGELAKKNAASFDARRKLESWLKGNIGALNRTQRIVIVAEEFDFKTLVTARWLREKHTVDITCVQCDFAKAGNDLLLSPVVLLPTAGLAELARDTRRPTAEQETSNWDSKIEAAQNREVAEFFREELSRDHEHDSEYLHLRANGERRIALGLRKKHAYVWQYRRFSGDITFWREKVGAEVESKDGGRSLSFTVNTRSALDQIQDAVTRDLPTKQFTETLP